MSESGEAHTHRSAADADAASRHEGYDERTCPHACPLCLAYEFVQQSGPETTEHLMRAGYELVLAVRSIVEGATRTMHEAERRRGGGPEGVESIPIRRD